MRGSALVITDQPNDTSWIPVARAGDLSLEALERLRDIALEYARLNGTVESESYLPPSPAGVLAMMVLRTRYHVRLSAPDRQELDTLLKLGALVFLGTGGDLRATTLASLSSLLMRISALSAEDGERSVAEAVVELGGVTADQVTESLSGRDCLFPDAGCRYLEVGTCRIDGSSVSAILVGLTSRKIVRQRTAAQPVRYSIVV
jgi:hypothetical protein